MSNNTAVTGGTPSQPQYHDMMDIFNLYNVTEMKMDESFSSIVNVSLPDAKERLQYVMEMTADAANKTMDAVDECIPLAKKHHETVQNILPSWKRLKDCKIKVALISSMTALSFLVFFLAPV